MYVDGLHDGCEGAASCAVSSPVAITGATAVALATFHVGTHTTSLGHATMDMAEMLIYKAVLTATEMDRIGNYLATKYGVASFRVNRNLRSAFRSAAVAQSPGCDQILVKPHKGRVCGGLVAGDCDNTGNLITLSSIEVDRDILVTSADNDYYNGMRLTITGGGKSNDGTVGSAVGQSCIITDYDGASREATCDLSQHGDFGYVLYGGADWPSPLDGDYSDEEVSDSVTTLVVSWAPDWKLPFYAAIGDPTATRELVLVTARAEVRGTHPGVRYSLTVERGYLNSAAVAITEANVLALTDVKKITYSRFAAIGTPLTAGTSLPINDIYGWTSTPQTGLTNLVASFTGKTVAGATKTVSVAKVLRAQWTLAADISAAATTFTFYARDDLLYFTTAANGDSLLDCDTVQIGDEKILLNGGGGTNGVVNCDGATPSVCTAGGTVVRGQESTTATAHKAGAIVYLYTHRECTTNAPKDPDVILCKNCHELVYASGTTTGADILGSDGILLDMKWAPQGEPEAPGTEYVGGSGISTYELSTCDTRKAPYNVDTSVTVVKDHAYLASARGEEEDVPAAVAPNKFFRAVSADQTNGGGTIVEIDGWFLMPSDLDLETASTTKGLTGPKLQRNLNYLLVTVGDRTQECTDPTRVVPCAQDGFPQRETRLQCAIWGAPAGYCADNWAKPCSCPDGVDCGDTCGGSVVCNNAPAAGTDYVMEATSRPALRCEVPGYLDTNADLNIYWHGIKTTLTNWYAPAEPVVTKVEPSSTSYAGGGMLTVHGANFGPESAWTGGGGSIVIEGKSMSATCIGPRFVSAEMLVCKAPPLSANQHDVDAVTSTVDVNVLVATSGGKRSRPSTAGAIKYSSVPSYFTCKVSLASQRDKNTCFTCCRSACMVDEVAAGATRGGATFSHCDTACYNYCGF